ncbi:hypothetical protein LK10_05405 [Sinomonas humi]|uniref:Uncharacterized protein n=1 Tax=Sinomonas humi TaxID=1338436 RepID=A0A0B2AM75_9MICC|nr:hypothetical protein LK10_05405 [Sinomonas humi]
MPHIRGSSRILGRKWKPGYAVARRSRPTLQNRPEVPHEVRIEPSAPREREWIQVQLVRTSPIEIVELLKPAKHVRPTAITAIARAFRLLNRQ